MLKYNLQRLFQLKGIHKPIVFLNNQGFTRGIASRLVKNQIKNLSTNHIEKLCLALKCSPNDLMEWTPNKPEQVNENNPLCSLINNSTQAFDLRNLGIDIPFNKLPQFAQKITELKNDLMTKG